MGFAHVLDSELLHVEIVVRDFTIFTMKKSNLDSWQVVIKLIFAITVTFTASSYSYCQAMLANPYFAPLPSSNFSTSSGNYI